MGKEKVEFQEALREGKKAPAHLPTREGIETFLGEIGINDDSLTAKVFVIASTTHLGAGEAISRLRALNEFVGAGETPNIIKMGMIAQLSDWIASATSPRDAMRATQNETFIELLNTTNLSFTYYSFLKIRGVLTYILHKAMQDAYRSMGFKVLTAYPEGCLLVGNKQFDPEKFSKKTLQNIEQLLKTALMDRDFLERATSMTIGQGMIANNELVTIESLPDLIDYAVSKVISLQAKTDDRKKAILLRFISTLQKAIRKKIDSFNISMDKKQEIKTKISELERENIGIDLGSLGLPTGYKPWNEALSKAASVLEKKGYASRNITTMPLDNVFESIKKAYLAVVEKMKPLFSDPEFSSIRSLRVDSYLGELIGDVSFPVLINQNEEGVAGPSPFHSMANKYYETYKAAKKRAMGAIDGDVRCPICGSAAPGTKAIAAGVGRGTKKFINMGIGTVRHDNINICNLCVLEGILRKMDKYAYGYVIMPQVSITAKQAEALAKEAKRLRTFHNNPQKAMKKFLDKSIFDYGKEIREHMEGLCRDDDIQTFQVSQNIVGNYVMMTTGTTKDRLSNSEELSMVLLQALALSIIFESRVRIIGGLDLIDISEQDGAVIFPANGSLLRTLKLRESMIDFDRIDEIGFKLASAKKIVPIADLTKKNGIQQALTTHPGQLALRIVRRRKYPRLSDEELMVLTNLQEVDTMGTLVDEISEILEQYYSPWGNNYRPRKYSTSMHSILGPMNALYTQFRKTVSMDEETVQAIAGRVLRQLQQLNNSRDDDFDQLVMEAAEPILNVCTRLAKRLSNESTRERKKILDDLRYAVFIRQLIAINKDSKKEKEKGGK